MNRVVRVIDFNINFQIESSTLNELMHTILNLINRVFSKEYLYPLFMFLFSSQLINDKIFVLNILLLILLSISMLNKM